MPFIYQWMIMATACALLDASLGHSGQQMTSDLVLLTGLFAFTHFVWTLWNFRSEERFIDEPVAENASYD